ncbi:glycosyltransferase family 4 protein [Pontibacter pamirensis]|uniref:glycosyltransferase family 4 protein n=1 Tax=Pontibacter pamirensis TaxID=2562824 RepID=UPI001389695A|nr:glycosyltransferase family 1 protein [Pontibacter pamirensis]
MKILYDHQIFVAQKFGGINRYYQEIMQLKGAATEVASINPELFRPVKSKVKTDLVSRGTRFLKRTMGLHEQNNTPLFPEEAFNIIKSGEYDIFHPTYYDPYFLDLTDKPFVLTVYDMIHEIFKEYFALTDRTSHNKLLLCQKAKHIIAISQNTKNDLIDIFNLPEDKITVIPLASNFDSVIPVQPQNTEGLKKYILFVGTRHIYKNFYFPVIALSELLKSDEELQLLCTGHPFTSDEFLFFRDLGILNQVLHIYPENDNELSWLYRHAALFIFPSLYEGFGFPMLEAFGTGCPVIASNGGSLPEVGNNAALYFDPKSIQEIQDAAQKVLYDTKLKESLVKNGEAQLKKFNWETCRAETLAVYKKVYNMT